MIINHLFAALCVNNLLHVYANESSVDDSSVLIAQEHGAVDIPDQLPPQQSPAEDFETATLEEQHDHSIEESQEDPLYLYEKNNHYANNFITINKTLYPYYESLDITPLPRNHLLSSFKFELSSNPANFSSPSHLDYTNYKVFPRSLSPILSSASAKDLHLRFTQGKWDSEVWGEIPDFGAQSGGIGIEVWASIESQDKEHAFKLWITLVNSLSGLFCASLNFIDSTNTISPVRSFTSSEDITKFNKDSNVYMFRSALPSEPVCTENLTPFVKFLPTRGKSGLSSLLDGHRIFQSEWHTMAIDIETKCEGELCHYHLKQQIDSVVDIQKVIRRKEQGSIPKPVRSEDLICDTSKTYDSNKCFPLNNPKEISFKLSEVFGRKVKGTSLISEKPTKVCFQAGRSWSAYLEMDNSHFGTDDNCFDLTESKEYDMYVTTEDSSDIVPIKESQIVVSRSLTGYGQDKGGSRTVFKNKSLLPIRLIYLETLPWFMRSYLHTLKVIGAPANKVIQSIHYTPEIDRERPTHYEFELLIPGNTTVAISYQFDKSLLLYAEYPPDANHGFSLEPGVVITVPEDSNSATYQIRTSPALLTLPTPDFSMPYNVIILTSTLMAFSFGSIFNLLTKRVMNEDDVEFLNAETGIKATLQKKIQRGKLSNLKKQEPVD